MKECRGVEVSRCLPAEAYTVIIFFYMYLMAKAGRDVENMKISDALFA
jgi:hypothetical protein